MIDVLIALLLSILVTAFLIFFNHWLQGRYRDQHANINTMHHPLDENEDELLLEPRTPEYNDDDNDDNGGGGGGNNEAHVVYTNHQRSEDNRRTQRVHQVP